ncbi:hypothetical protein [Streptomyces sp. NPDC057694]|uniref:hypothetical protein n=1 Tax=Streptomyces sp. NPDC057694 TaxID=3346216 RepID=UPI00368FAF4C
MPSFFMESAAMLARQADELLAERKRDARRRGGAHGRRMAEAAREKSVSNALDELRRKLTLGMISRQEFDKGVALLKGVEGVSLLKGKGRSSN